MSVVVHLKDSEREDDPQADVGSMSNESSGDGAIVLVPQHEWKRQCFEFIEKANES